jgi:hypothetical protein
LSDDLGHSCLECNRDFGSRRALTQHTRYVHDGASLFGQQLVDNSEQLIDDDSEDRYWSEPTEDEDEANADTDTVTGEEARPLWPIAVALAGIAVLVMLRSLPPEPRVETITPPGSHYGFGLAGG